MENLESGLSNTRRWLSVLFLIAALAAAIYGSIKLGTANNVINHEQEKDPNYVMPEKEKERLDILVLGMRGENDPDAQAAGAYLTDTIMVFSYDKVSGKSSVVSIPRDLYIKIGGKQEKINAAFEYGLAKKEGVEYVKELFSRITGIYIDYAAVIDFSSFEQIIDQVGGVDIVLEKPFAEKNQWGYEFDLPAGENHLDGKGALYYARSRFSTNDFDRSRRQQQILFALKDKLAQIDFFSEPVKALEIFNTVRNNIYTDVGLWDIKNFLNLGDKINGNTKHYVISIENLVYESNTNGSYVLLPNSDNFNGIKQLFQDILK